ncbi:MAG TPA: DUF4405 domain-containing protein [Phycisphaerae bacterium]|jgi:hypothetical protein|nr:DUF4405 domain-containing protein [Phycisphaerae bacterium]HOB75441.1 DUF4405 domain-containing protein [Phycisphaerae bacterium]HOJ56699.1 DUF4405 domain-containing protein [Phycisphaerae bacterium]HOL28446.1 DUF4405 domain-containing protein [Phycisphaerae bacterium]HPP22941.1 DUF4405 domain-containing protein [Phycisphaerae bacterium]
MRRSRLNFWIDTLALFAMLGLIATGWVIYYTLPAGSGGHGRGAAWTLWGWSRHDWGNLHFWLAVGMVGLLLVHLVLHWGWICAMTQSLLPGGNGGTKRLGTATRTILGGTTLLAFAGLFGLFAWIAEAQAIRPATASGGSSRPALAEAGAVHEEQEQEIRGHMTLEQVAAKAGVSIHELRERLGLPESVSDQVGIGQLRRQHGVEIAAVREAVADLRASAAR